jgi:hypothetical protein
MGYATLAEYLDSTPERRARRDAMLAMCDEIQANARDPWRQFADAEGFLAFTGRRNQITGEVTEVAHEIHKDDLPWYERLWLEADEIEYRVTLAKLARGAEG